MGHYLNSPLEFAPRKSAGRAGWDVTYFILGKKKPYSPFLTSVTKTALCPFLPYFFFQPY